MHDNNLTLLQFNQFILKGCFACVNKFCNFMFLHVKYFIIGVELSKLKQQDISMVTTVVETFGLLPLHTIDW